jgi:NADH-quinone oxidoreductase subunit N
MNDVFSNVLRDIFPAILPETVLVTAAAVIFLGGTVRAGRDLWGALSLLSLILALLAFISQTGPRATAGDEEKARVALYAAPLVFDHLAWLIRIIALGSGIVLVLMSWHEVPDNQAPDHQACLLVVIAGLSLVGLANDLVTLFLALELISIPTYILLYLPRHDEASQEAAMKYFLLSIFSSALVLFGFSYLYGVTGTTNISAILQTLQGGNKPELAAVALILIVAGLGYRITLVPFHFYAPDVYQGAPTVVAAVLAFVQKAAGFVALIRVLGFVVPAEMDSLVPLAATEQVIFLFWFLAAITMFLGNVMGLLQNNVKRLLAYSSIAHAGYMLIALAVTPALGRNEGGTSGIEALLFYLVAYGAMTVGAFAVLSYLSSSIRRVDTLDDLAGLSQSHPGIALFMVLFLFSLIGIPMTAGFMGKLLIFLGAMGVSGTYAEWFRVLAVLGVINAAIAGWYYLKIIAAMYLRTGLRPLENQRSWPGLVTLLLCGLLTVCLSIPPASDWLLEAAQQAAQPTAAKDAGN